MVSHADVMLDLPGWFGYLALPPVVDGWRFGLVVVPRSLSTYLVVTLRRAWLVPGWVTAFGWVNYLGM